MANGDSFIPILYPDLEANGEWANGVMKNATWRAQRKVRRTDGKLITDMVRPGEQFEDTVHLVQLSEELSGGSAILRPEINKVLVSIRDGICIGLHLAMQYSKRSSLDVLQQRNRAGQLSEPEKAEFGAKVTTSSAVALFAAAAYVVNQLATYEQSKISGIKVDFAGAPELSFRNPQSALQCLLWHFGRYCTPEAAVVNNNLEMVKLALLYFESVISEVHDKRDSFMHTEAFTEAAYRLEGTDFTVKGFEINRHTANVSVEFKKIDFGQIVGNRRAKHQALRTAMILCCYDVKERKNPFLEFGSFPLVEMGYGRPGTGKSLQIAATATKIQELCEKLEMPFLFWPMPAAIVSTFQGGSAERMEDWMRRLTDDDKIVYGPIDDAENNFMNRSREGVSAGVREVISVFLRNTEGASAIVRGNSSIQMFTNLPEIIDPAVLSRVQRRFPIDGAVTIEDFLDQDHLWWKRFASIDAEFVNMKNGTGYEYLANQKPLRNLAELETLPDEVYRIKDRKIAEAIDRVGKKYTKTDHGFFGELFFAVRKYYPSFSSRDVRNIQSAVDSRILDFDLPHEWFEDPKLFYKRDYTCKVELLRAEVKRNMKGLSFHEIRFDETVRYLDTLAGIAQVDFERQVAEAVRRIDVHMEAEQQVKSRKSVQ
jgi:hypothetical protein